MDPRLQKWLAAMAGLLGHTGGRRLDRSPYDLPTPPSEAAGTVPIPYPGYRGPNDRPAMKQVITSAGMGPLQPPKDPGEARRMMIKELSSRMRNAKTDDEHADALEAILELTHSVK